MLMPLRYSCQLKTFMCLISCCAVVNGHIKRPQDEDIQSNVLEIVGSNIQSTYITCPADPSATLSIKLPFLVIIVKNLKKYFTFEIQVLDDKNVRRRFRASNFQVCKFAPICWCLSVPCPFFFVFCYFKLYFDNYWWLLSILVKNRTKETSNLFGESLLLLWAVQNLDPMITLVLCCLGIMHCSLFSVLCDLMSEHGAVIYSSANGIRNVLTTRRFGEICYTFNLLLSSFYGYTGWIPSKYN